MSEEENICDLPVEHLLGLINSADKSIVREVRNLIKEQFSTVTDKWLTHGLLEYFFTTNSKRILDMLIIAPEPHCRYLLEKISSGLRSREPFRYVSLLLYAVSQNPPPIWIEKIPHFILKELLDILLPGRDSDINVLVSGVMVLVVLLPLLPFHFSKSRNRFFECFWRLVHWSPSRQDDVALKPYLQVAVYSLFHRLYALFPCSLISFLRDNTVGQSDKSYFNTLAPMLEQVRFHPLLVSETKESEVSRSRWTGLEPNDLIHECAKLCLDPLHEICEEVYTNVSAVHDTTDLSMESNEFLVLCSSENSFWSPGASCSPGDMSTSVPHTPVYSIHLSNQLKVAESPPEAAIEATPETTPFTSPVPYYNSKATSQATSKPNSGSGDPNSENRFSFNYKLGQEFLMKSEKSNLLQSKLLEIQKQRVSVPRLKVSDLRQFTDDSKPDGLTNANDESQEEWNKNGADSLLPNEDKKQATNGVHDPIVRKRKLAVCVSKHLDNFGSDKENDLFSEDSNEENIDQEAACERKDSPLANGDKGLMENGNAEAFGLPSRQSVNEMMKSVKSNRLRFLSQCGPPPNVALISESSSSSVSPVKSSNKSLSSELKMRRKSYPDCTSLQIVKCLNLPKRECTLSSLSLSPIKVPVEMIDMSTQTEDAPVLDPYEQLFEVLTLPTQKGKTPKDVGIPSPYELVNQLIEHNSSVEDSKANFDLCWNSHICASDCKCQNHLRSLRCLYVMEKYKRERHAERNRRFLGKVKKLHMLQENNLGLNKEKKDLKREITSLQSSLSKFQSENNKLEEKMKETVDKQLMVDLQRRLATVTLQRDQMQCTCESLHRHKSSLIAQLEACQSQNSEYNRRLGIFEHHSTENSVLRTQVEDLNKKIIMMGEIQLEMHRQIQNFKENQKRAQNEAIALEKAAFADKLQALEQKNSLEKSSLQAAMYRINELEQKLSTLHTEKMKHANDMEYLSSSWEERLSSSEKRNDDLCAIINTLESQMLQLRQAPKSADSSDTASGSTLKTSLSKSHFPEPNANSYLSKVTSKDNFEVCSIGKK